MQQHEHPCLTAPLRRSGAEMELSQNDTFYYEVWEWKKGWANSKQGSMPGGNSKGRGDQSVPWSCGLFPAIGEMST